MYLIPLSLQHIFFLKHFLTDCSLVTPYEALVIIGSGNYLFPVWPQAITCTNVDFLSIEPLGTNVKEFFNQNTKTCMHLKM